MEKSDDTKVYLGIGRYMLALFFFVESAICFLNPIVITDIIPAWIPFPMFWTFLFGIIWLIAAVSFTLNTWTYLTGTLIALFILAIASLDTFNQFSSENSVSLLLKVTSYIALAGGALMVSTSNNSFTHKSNGLYIWGRILVGIFFLTAGIMHLTNVDYDATMISTFPMAKALVIFTGICWIATALSYWSNIMSRLSGILASLLIVIITISITLNEFSMQSAWGGIFSIAKNIGLMGCCILVAAYGTILPRKLKK